MKKIQKNTNFKNRIPSTLKKHLNFPEADPRKELYLEEGIKRGHHNPGSTNNREFFASDPRGFSIRVAESPTMMFANEVQPRKVSSLMLGLDLAMVMLTREVQPAKARPSMWVTDSPKVTLAKEVHPSKALAPMCSTDSPKVMFSREVQAWKILKGKVPNVHHRLTQGDVRQRGAVLKGTISNVSHRFTKSDAHQRAARYDRHSSQCAPQNHPK